jgi:hypothetical protein
MEGIYITELAFSIRKTRNVKNERYVYNRSSNSSNRYHYSRNSQLRILIAAFSIAYSVTDSDKHTNAHTYAQRYTSTDCNSYSNASTLFHSNAYRTAYRTAYSNFYTYSNAGSSNIEWRRSHIPTTVPQRHHPTLHHTS